MPQIFLAHARALQVPSREAFSPRRHPSHDVPRFRLLPDGEIVRRSLVLLAVKRAGALQGVIQRTSRKDAVLVVIVVLSDIEVDASVAFVGIAGREDSLDSLDLFDDVAGSPGLDGRRSHIQHPHRFVIAQGVGLDNFHRLQLLEPCLLCDLVLPVIRIVLQVAHIGDVPDVTDLVAQMSEEFEEHVICHSRSGMSQMGISVDGRTADVHSYVTGIHRDEEFFLTRQGICQK